MKDSILIVLVMAIPLYVISRGIVCSIENLAKAVHDWRVRRRVLDEFAAELGVRRKLLESNDSFSKRIYKAAGVSGVFRK